MALILALFFSVIVSGLVVTGSIVLTSNKKKTETNFRVYGQATQFARSGLTETLTWFRRQTTQPVLEFTPRVDNTATPPVLDSDDPDIGIMREFQISGEVWGRYEVWKEWPSDPDPARKAWRDLYEARDVSKLRSLRSDGVAWSVRSVGYVFRRPDPSKAFDEAPNRVLGSQILETEFFRLALAPPGQSALSVSSGTDAHINTFGRIRGGAKGSGIYYKSGTGSPTVGPVADKRVSGTPDLSPDPNYRGSIEDVFGVTLSELRAIADFVITNPADFPSPIPSYSIIVCEVANIQFDATRPLKGIGIVYIKGNVTIAKGSNSVFNGLLYIDGSLTMRDPSEINGAVVVNGNLTLQGMPDYATINYDEDVLNSLRREIGSYKMSGAIRPVLHVK